MHNQQVCFMQGSHVLCPVNSVPHLGAGSLVNYLAAFALLKPLEIPMSDIVCACQNFKGLLHRCEKLTVPHDTAVYNDSKATNSAAMLSALNALDKYDHIILIAGGVYKEAEVPLFPESIKKKLKMVLLFGKDRKLLYDSWSEQVLCQCVSTLEDATQRAFACYAANDCIILSPACASYDQFTNFEERGRMFKHYVLANSTST